MSQHAPTPHHNPARRAAVRIAQTLTDAGHVAYLAGGCVRDELLGLTPKDYDVATDARPDRVRALFRNSRYVGEAFGVVLVRLQGEEVEVATFRTEWGYSDGRRPDHVQFSDAEHDAQRRDFTINGLFEDPATNKVIDFVGGQEDLRLGLIRAIGDPNARFAEDYLRMLRAVRIAARLGFVIEPNTSAAIRAHADKLARISRERIGLEVQAMLTGPRPAEAVRLIQELHLDAPTLNEPHRCVAVPTVAALGPQPTYPCGLAAWMLDRHCGESLRTTEPPPLRAVLKGWRDALCLSNEERDAVAAILSHLPTALRWPTLGVAQRKRLLAQAIWPQLWRLVQALGTAYERADVVRAIEAEAPALFADDVAPPPLITGDDLIELGLQPGPAFRRILDAVYDAQLEGRITTRPEALDRAQKMSMEQ